jgi:hypothetical protein
MSFQTQTNAVPAPGIAGDFASTNPRHNTLAGPTGFVAGAAGLACGKFAWADTATYSILNNFGSGKPNGFVHNAHNALITAFLGEATLVIPAGFPVGDLFDAGDFWVANPTGAAVIPGQKVYVNTSTGAVSAFAATGTLTTAGTSTASTIAAGTSSVTASIAIPVAGATLGPGTVPAIMTVTAVGSGTVYPGTVLSGTNIATGTQVVAQILPLIAGETAGGVGRYSVSIAQTAGSTTVSGTYGLLTIGGTVVSGFAVGQAITAASAGTVITALGTGTGGAGTYIVNNTQTVNSTAINSYIGIETDWYSASFGNGTAGEFIKITVRWP